MPAEEVYFLIQEHRLKIMLTTLEDMEQYFQIYDLDLIEPQQFFVFDWLGRYYPFTIIEEREDPDNPSSPLQKKVKISRSEFKFDKKQLFHDALVETYKYFHDKTPNEHGINLQRAKYRLAGIFYIP